MKEVDHMDELITIDIEGFLEGENDPDCVTLLFDLQGRAVE